MVSAFLRVEDGRDTHTQPSVWGETLVLDFFGDFHGLWWRSRARKEVVWEQRRQLESLLAFGVMQTR